MLCSVLSWTDKWAAQLLPQGVPRLVPPSPAPIPMLLLALLAAKERCDRSHQPQRLFTAFGEIRR